MKMQKSMAWSLYYMRYMVTGMMNRNLFWESVRKNSFHMSFSWMLRVHMGMGQDMIGVGWLGCMGRTMENTTMMRMADNHKKRTVGEDKMRGVEGYKRQEMFGRCTRMTGECRERAGVSRMRMGVDCRQGMKRYCMEQRVGSKQLGVEVHRTAAQSMASPQCMKGRMGKKALMGCKGKFGKRGMGKGCKLQKRKWREV